MRHPLSHTLHARRLNAKRKICIVECRCCGEFTGDYYFIKNGNDLVDLGIATCNGTLTGALPAAPSGASSAPGPAATNTEKVQANAAHGGAQAGGAVAAGVLGGAALLVVSLML